MANRKAGRPADLERSIISQQAEAEALFTSIGDGAISTDEFGRITRVNPVALQILGYEENELIHQWFPKKVVATYADGSTVNLIDRPITRAFLTGKSIIEKMYYRRKNGTIIPVYTNVAPIMLNDVPIGAIEVFRDITLEQEVDRMKSEFISLASHQLRTPLSAIKTYSHMLVDGYMGELNDTQKRSMRTIISAANRMNELISTLLNITRMESGTIAVTPKLLQVDTACEEVVKELSLMAGERGVNLELKNVGNTPKNARTDNLILKEIITNLVSNSIKYTPEGGSVTIVIRKRDDNIILAVKDTGWGIPETVQEQIFSKFFRAPNIVKRETTGTGLGLYLVKGLTEALGGRIWFKSEEGKGTDFYVSIPTIRSRPARKSQLTTKEAM